jgi:hypothetical protein
MPQSRPIPQMLLMSLGRTLCHGNLYHLSSLVISPVFSADLPNSTRLQVVFGTKLALSTLTAHARGTGLS